MNDELSDAITESVQDIFQGFLAMAVQPGVRSAEGCRQLADSTAEREATAPQETATMVGFTGALRGGVILGAPEATALILAGALAGKPVDSLAGRGVDLLGELTDLIAGGMRTRLSSHGEIHLTPPIVVVGNRYTLNNAAFLSRVRQFFQINGGNFCVECFYLKDFS